MKKINHSGLAVAGALMVCFNLQACTVKAVGDPNRPITIHHHITIDIKGLENTATNIEDFVSGDKADVGVAQD